MLKIGVTGGIGSGKSTLCRLFASFGVPVYDSDHRAKKLMSSSEELRKSISEAFGSESYVDGELNRPYLAQKVFTSPENLERLNSLVHPCVRADFAAWCSDQQQQGAQYIILECAILFEAGFNESVDKVLCVLSPEPLRIERVISRDTLTAKQVEDRINNQMPDAQVHALSDFCVVNIEMEDLEQAAAIFDKKFRNVAQKY